MRKCSECSHDMIECDRTGRPAAGGGYLVCALALREHDPAEFQKPYQQRTHREARIEELPATARARRAAIERQPLLFPGPDVGKRAVVLVED